MHFLISIMVLVVLSGCVSTPPPKPPPTFEERQANVFACGTEAAPKNPAFCADDHYRFYRAVARGNYRGRSADEVSENLKAALENGHIAAHFDFTHLLMKDGDPAAYQMALKTKELFEKLEDKDKSLHSLREVNEAGSFRPQPNPKEEIDKLVKRAEILDPEKGRLLSKKEIWERLKPLSNEKSWNHHGFEVYGIGRLSRRNTFTIQSFSYYPLFVKAAELDVPEAVYHLGRMHYDRTTPQSSRETAKEDFEKYEAYMEQARGLNYPPAFMDRLRVFSDKARRNAAHDLKVKWRKEAMDDVKKAVDLDYPPAMAAWGKDLTNQYQRENDPAKKAKLKEEALIHLLIAQKSGEKNLEKDILYLRDEKTYLAQERHAIEQMQASFQRHQARQQQKLQTEEKILSMLREGRVTTQADVDFICANTPKITGPNTIHNRALRAKGTNCDWAQAQLAEQGLKKIRQQNAGSGQKWQGFTYTKETTDRYNRTVRESEQKRDMRMFNEKLNHKIRSKGLK